MESVPASCGGTAEMCFGDFSKGALSSSWFYVEAAVGPTFPQEDQSLAKDRGVAVFPLCYRALD